MKLSFLQSVTYVPTLSLCAGKISPFVVVFCDIYLLIFALSFSSRKWRLLTDFCEKRKEQFFIFHIPDVPVSSLPLQTSVVEGIRSAGRSRGDEAIQSVGRKKKRFTGAGFNEVCSISKWRNEKRGILTSGFRDKFFLQIWWYCPSNINFLSEGQDAKYIKCKHLY